MRDCARLGIILHHVNGYEIYTLRGQYLHLIEHLKIKRKCTA